MNLTPGLVKSVMGQAENRTQSGFIGSQIEFTKSAKDCLSQECHNWCSDGDFQEFGSFGTFNHFELGNKF